MESAQAGSQSPEQLETEQLRDLEQTVSIIMRMQKAFLPQIVVPGELSVTNGRKCMLVVDDLQFNSSAHYFQVTETGVELVEPYDTYDTAIIAPLDSILNVLKATLAGHEDPFGDEWTRGRARLVGDNRFHDGLAFKTVFQRLAGQIRKYRGGA